MSPSLPVCVWPLSAELGEGPFWHAAEQALYFVDIKGQAIHRCAADGSARRSWPTPRAPGFVLPQDDGTLVCGMADGLHAFDAASGEFATLLHMDQEARGNRLNDGYVDAHGQLWFGSMDNAEQQPSGALYRWQHGGAAVLQDRDYVITNGPAMSPDGKILYHTDTLQRTVYAFDVDATGNLSHKRALIHIDGTGYPDGMAVDADGFIWIALFGGWRIERFTPAGQLDSMIRFPCANVTKLVFGGADLCTVHVTTAWKGLSPEQRLQQPLAGGLFSFSVDTPGLAQHHLSTEVQK